VGRKEGLTETQLQNLPQFESSPHFTAKEKLVLRLTVALTRTPANVSDELYAALQKEFSELELVELSAVITWENCRARFNRTFAIAAEGFSEGQFCPLPEHAPSSRASSAAGA
jgi:alkylhydroperoxidase family enzyme